MRCEDVHGWKLWVILLVYSSLEYWLGKTKRIKASSTIELFITALVVIVAAAIQKWRKKNDKTI